MECVVLMLYFFRYKFNFRNFLDFCVRSVKIMIQILVKKNDGFFKRTIQYKHFT